MQLDRDEVAPLLEALRASSGDARDAVLGALARLPLDPEVAGELGLTPTTFEADSRGFAVALGDLDAGVEGNMPAPSWFGEPVPWFEADVAPIVVTRWFERALGEHVDVHAGADIVAWVHVYGERFRPDLDGLFAQYRRAAQPGTWSRTKPDRASDLHRILAWQIAWTVSRGGLRGLVPGLAPALLSQAARTVAAQLIADAAANVREAEPPTLGLGYQAAPRAEHVELSGLLRDAALAGVVPYVPAPSTLLAEGAPPPAPAAEYEPRPPAAPRAQRPVGWIVALAVLAGSALAVAKWVFGWLTLAGEAPARSDEVQCTVFAPPAATPGGTILVQVFAHLPADAADAKAIATELDVRARRRAFRSLTDRVPVGSRLDFELRLPGLEVDEPVASLVWQGRTEAVQFGVHVPDARPPGAIIGTVSIGRDGVPLGHVKFALAIAAGETAAPEPQGVDAKRYRVAFVSYTSRDRDEVLRRVQMLPVAGLRYFQDVLSLELGETWSERIEQAIREADVFLLFWSSRAKESEWVRREVDYALDLKAGDELAAPEIRPVIIEGPPVIAPWDDLAHLHFNDRVLYFISRPTS